MKQRKLKPLKQDDFKMEIVQDLGLINSTRKAIFKCSKCEMNSERKVSTVKFAKVRCCNKCANKKDNPISKHKLYHTWFNEKRRCYDKREIGYKHYGARGIIVHELFHDFKTWLNYVENLPNAYAYGYNIDRVNNDANYEPMNLKWATYSEQIINQRMIKVINKSGYRGVHWSKTRKKWVASIGVKGRYKNLGGYENVIEAAKAYNQFIVENNLAYPLNKVD